MTATAPTAAAASTPAAGRPRPVERPQFGAVTYLNSKPLIEDLADLIAPAALSQDYPSHLARDLADQRLDVALVPSFSALRGLVDGSAWLLSDACVASRGPVRSVKLLCRCHPGEVRTLALDAGSRTSQALVQIILQEHYGAQPRLQPFPLETATRDCDADAILMIGDRAMTPPPGDRFVDVLDLGEVWTRWTGLPFVFAVWATRHAEVPAEWAEALATARDRGLARIDAIAEREAAALHLTDADAAGYLRNNLHFTLGSAERAGLALFAELATECGLLPAAPAVREARVEAVQRRSA